MFYLQANTYYIPKLHRTGKMTFGDFITNVLESRKLWVYRASVVMAICEKEVFLNLTFIFL